MKVTIIASFGFRHGKLKTEENALVIDVCRAFNRNPCHDKRLRHLRGDDPRVAADILKTSAFDEHYAQLKRRVRDHEGPVYLGCTGGHHRSVYLGKRLSEELGVPVSHLNYDDH